LKRASNSCVGSAPLLKELNVSVLLKLASRLPDNRIHAFGRLRGRAPWIKRATDWIPDRNGCTRPISKATDKRCTSALLAREVERRWSSASEQPALRDLHAHFDVGVWLLADAHQRGLLENPAPNVALALRPTDGT
jgi:hypothetical protein